MPRVVSRALFACFVICIPAAVAAQTSTIAGEVRDSSGAVLPGVTVEVTSPALIERVRSATTDGSGQYKIVELRPGTYTVTFTLPGFATVKRDNVELTSDFTATINASMNVGAVTETITVAAQSPVVDVQSVTQRTVMTRDVLDVIPTGRNIQAVGIMIPGTNLTVGGGGALNRDVGGSGTLQQSPLNYRGSNDTIQTIEGMRLNNLCANGAYSGVYWNDGSFQEISYVTGSDSAEMGQGGLRVNMVPKDGGNTFHASIFGNYAPGSWATTNVSGNLHGDVTFNPNNRLTNVSNLDKIWDFNPSAGGPIKKDKAWFQATFRHWGASKTVPDSFFDADPNPFRYVPDRSRIGLDDGHIKSGVGRILWQVSGKDKISGYQDTQHKYRNHWGISANVPPEASAIQVTPTSFVNVEKWTRTQSSRLLFDGGFAMYDQEYQENYRPEVNAFTPQQLYTLYDQSTGKYANAWNNPADHFSKLFTESLSASYVTGSHAFKVGFAVSEGRWRLVQRWTGDIGVNPTTGSQNNGIAYNGLLPNGNINPVSVTFRLPFDRRNSIKADTGIFAQDRWTINRLTINAGVRLDWFIGETLPEDLLASEFGPAQHFDRCPDGINNNTLQCTGRVQNWKDLNPRVGVAYDLFGTGRTAVKASFARYVNGEQIGTADAANPLTTLGLFDVRTWNDLDGNGSPFAANGTLQFNELTGTPTTATFGKNTNTRSTDPSVLNGWFKRGYNEEIGFSVQHELVPRVSVNVGYGRRWFGNQTVIDDLRYNNSSYDGPFCITAPSDPNLPNGGGYQVCNLYDLKPALVNLPASSIIRFSSDFGGQTFVSQGLDFTVDTRLARGTFLKGGVTMSKITSDTCNLAAAGFDLQPTNGGAGGPVSPQLETYSNGERACHQVFPFRPDLKLSASHQLPLDFVISGVYQFSRGVQGSGAGGQSILATWAASNAVIAPALGRNLSSGTTKTVQLVQPGTVYSTTFGAVDLNQLDIRASKRIPLGRARVRIDADLYNAFNNEWPYTLNNTFTTAVTSAWLRPTNVLQGRFFKLGAQVDF